MHICITCTLLCLIYKIKSLLSLVEVKLHIESVWIKRYRRFRHCCQPRNLRGNEGTFLYYLEAKAFSNDDIKDAHLIYALQINTL